MFAAPPVIETSLFVRIPESLHGWLFGQMLAWFGIVYFGLTEDLRWYVAGLVSPVELDPDTVFERIALVRPRSRCPGGP